MIGMSCYLYTLDRLPVTISSTFAYVTPVITALLGHWFLGEAIPPTMVAGMLVIFMGIALIQKLSYNNNKAVVEALDS
jgi:drug/metabolite transporter (DMT)-like permease